MLRAMMGQKYITITIRIQLGYPELLGAIKFYLNGETIQASSELMTIKLKKGDTIGFEGGAHVWRYNVIVDGIHVGVSCRPGMGDPPFFYTFSKSSLVELTYFDADF